MGGGVVLRADAERFVQPCSVGRVCLVEDRHEPAQFCDRRLDVFDRQRWGSGPKNRLQFGLRSTLLVGGFRDPATDGRRVRAGVQSGAVLGELLSGLGEPSLRRVDAGGSFVVPTGRVDELLSGVRDSLRGEELGDPLVERL